MNPDRSTYTSASNNTSTVRPRNRRLISYSDGNDSEQEDAGSSRWWSQPTPSSPLPSRGVSPIPVAHPSRSQSSTVKAGSVTDHGNSSKKSNRGQVNASSSLGLWDSWSSLQGLASTLLGSDAQQGSKGKNDGAFTKAIWGKPSKISGPRPLAPQWGPETGAGRNVAPGSKEERHAMVQAKKREALLLANEFSNSTAPHKRRDSDLRLSHSAILAEQEEDALVYVHKVKPEDTLAGVMIRYQCQPAVFRKVNRLWPNDNIQIRDRVFLPVEACAVRGRKVDTNDSTSAHETSSSSHHHQHNSSNKFDLHTDPTSPSFSPKTSNTLDPEYKHEYFVSIPNIPENVEIGRIPRRTLGFFPPSRRKSQTYSDADHPYTDSARPSLDVSARLNSLSLSLNASPSRSRLVSRPHRSGSGSCFVDRLKGPGGVGTLRGGSGLGGMGVSPGPAQDSLNKMFAHHLPNVAPRESFDSVHSASSTGLENVGGVIEGWVRKVGTRLAGTVEPAEAYRRQGRMADLIELESSAEAAEDQGAGLGADEEGILTAAFDGPASGRPSRELLSRGKGTANSNAHAHANVGATVTATEEALLRERFPPRGRMVDALPTNRPR
jgi:hypothetical protein